MLKLLGALLSRPYNVFRAGLILNSPMFSSDRDVGFSMRVVLSSEAPQEPLRFTGTGVISRRSERTFFNSPASAALSDIEISGCQLSKSNVPVVTRRVEESDDFRYMKRLATETEFDVCGARCATFVRGELLLHAATSDEIPPPYSRYAWKGSTDRRGRFARVR